LSSSIFSFERCVSSLTVLAVLLATMAGLEVATRTALIPASMDLSRFTQYPAQARALGAASGRRVAFVGNSITDLGVDPALFGRILGDVTAGLFVADASGINTWAWIIEREFWKQSVSPDLVILNFAGSSLDDGQQLELGRLGLFFTDHRDWSELFRHDVTSLEGRCEFLLSTVWATYAVRARIKERALGLLPGYKRYLAVQNQVNFYAEESPVKSATHETLRRLLTKAQAHRTLLLVVAFPMKGTKPARPSYSIPDEIPRLVAAAGMLYLDLRYVNELGSQHYKDRVHLNPEGREIYTRILAEALSEIWDP
jgi:hypothetical protein